jgi:hypothetical protein
MPAKSDKQQTAARIAHAIKKGKVKPKPGTASAEMAKDMTDKKIKHFMVKEEDGGTTSVNVGGGPASSPPKKKSSSNLPPAFLANIKKKKGEKEKGKAEKEKSEAALRRVMNLVYQEEARQRRERPVGTSSSSVRG